MRGTAEGRDFKRASRRFLSFLSTDWEIEKIRPFSNGGFLFFFFFPEERSRDYAILSG